MRACVCVITKIMCFILRIMTTYGSSYLDCGNMIDFEFLVLKCERGLHVSTFALVNTSFFLPSYSFSPLLCPFQWPYNVVTW